MSASCSASTTDPLPTLGELEELERLAALAQSGPVEVYDVDAVLVKEGHWDLYRRNRNEHALPIAVLDHSRDGSPNFREQTGHIAQVLAAAYNALPQLLTAARQLVAAQARVGELENLAGLVRGESHFLILNANDTWAWASADCCNVDVDGPGFDLLLEMRKRWGSEGVLAFMAEGEQLEPQAPLMKLIDQTAYREAREFVRGKETGVWRSMAHAEYQLAAERKVNATLRTDLAAAREALRLLWYWAECDKAVRPLNTSNTAEAIRKAMPELWRGEALAAKGGGGDV